MCDPNFMKDIDWNKVLKAQWEEAVKKIEGYHIHIYFDKGTQSELTARGISEGLNQMFPDHIEGTYDVRIVGPHTKPNIELDIKTEGFGEIVQWLQKNSHGLSILVHPETGDDVVDHLQSSMWINKETAYNQDFFDRLIAARRQAPAPKPGM